MCVTPFNSISDKHTRAPEKIIHNDSINREVYLRPVGFSGVAVCKPADIEKIENSKKEVVNLGKELCAISNASFFLLFVFFLKYYAYFIQLTKETKSLKFFP